jgi:hypothetical protein
MKRSRHLHILSRHIRAVLDKNPSNIRLSMCRRQMKWGGLVDVLGPRIRVTIEKKQSNIHVPASRSVMQRSPPLRVLDIHIRIEKNPNDVHMSAS